jgi:hypothetical protein
MRLGHAVCMSPLMKTLMRFAQSRQGRKLTQQATNYAKSPKGKRQIEQARAQLNARKRPR